MWASRKPLWLSRLKSLYNPGSFYLKAGGFMADKKNKKTEDEDAADALPPPPEGGEDGADPLAEGGGKKFNAKKIILFLVAPLLVLIGVGAGLYFSGFLDSFLKKEEAPAGEHAVAEGEGAVDEHGKPLTGAPAFVKIPDMIVNLSGAEGQPRYLRLAVQLELKNAADSAAIEAVMPRVVDQFQTYLRELRVKDLRGSAGIYRLQMELLSRVNAAAYPVEVKDVLFQEILIQ
jgi:flagellar FliL protein